ncbi:leukocyte tyrosine kinase receptor-like [Acropora millepora]|uniref:leukocyte tyrosine kinase receptor-like n=1 Tax=Acropora millepora TaxID=45264 RepID=UPI001CF117AD|nr:leukocyte tyrosine kinase receptor-like [Acropora millepora]
MAPTKPLLSSSILFIVINTVRLQLQTTETSRSSTVSITENQVLMGCGIHKQRSYDFLSCVHLCLVRSSCASVNYENVENGMCELNRPPSPTSVTNKALPGYLFGQLVILQDHKYIFTTLGASGAHGPTSTAGYQGTSLEDQVILNKGIQIWTVLVTGSYVIEAAGASGGNGSYRFVPWKLGGLGAKITGTFQLNRGTQLKILVGQEGTTVTAFRWHMPGTGGGGSFVTLSDDTPLMVAGGGGGGGVRGKFAGDPGQATRNGSQCGGTQGGEGKVCNAITGQEDFSLAAGGGAGLRGSGRLLRACSFRAALAPRGFITGGTGGQWIRSNGGFGGGSSACKLLGGGGGGYSGGGVLATKEIGTAGGGGSYNVGKHQLNMAGANKGDGKVIITLVAYA